MWLKIESSADGESKVGKGLCPKLDDRRLKNKRKIKKLRLIRIVQSDLIRSINFFHDKIEDCNSSLIQQEKVLQEYLQRIEAVEKENLLLEYKVNNMEQY